MAFKAKQQISELAESYYSPQDFNTFTSCHLTISYFRGLTARFQKRATILFVLRVMVGAIILYDHVHPVGAFYKRSNIDVSYTGVREGSWRGLIKG